MTWMIAAMCAALTAWIVEWAQRRVEQWSEDQAWAKAQGDTPPNDQSRVGRSPTRRRIICRTKVPAMKATTHSETLAAAMALTALAVSGHDYL
jgi:uncharacterized membrane protein YebE (DUF533 family)